MKNSLPLPPFSCLSFWLLASRKRSSLNYKRSKILQKICLTAQLLSLNTCDEEKAAALASVASLQEQIRFLKENNSDLIDNLGNLTTLSQKGAENLEKSLESLKEKDLELQA